MECWAICDRDANNDFERNDYQRFYLCSHAARVNITSAIRLLSIPRERLKISIITPCAGSLIRLLMYGFRWNIPFLYPCRDFISLFFTTNHTQLLGLGPTHREVQASNGVTAELIVFTDTITLYAFRLNDLVLNKIYICVLSQVTVLEISYRPNIFGWYCRWSVYAMLYWIPTLSCSKTRKWHVGYRHLN